MFKPGFMQVFMHILLNQDIFRLSKTSSLKLASDNEFQTYFCSSGTHFCQSEREFHSSENEINFGVFLGSISLKQEDFHLSEIIFA